MRPNLRLHVWASNRVPAPLLLDIYLVDPADKSSDDPDQQNVNEGPHAPRPASCRRFRLPARREVFAIHRFKICRKVWPLSQPLCRFKPPGRVGQPSGGLAIRNPVPRRTLDAINNAEEPSIFCQPALKQAPLPQKCLMRGFDRLFARAAGEVGREKALFDEMLDQWPSLSRDFRESSNATTRGTRIRVNPGKPRNQAATEQG